MKKRTKKILSGVLAFSIALSTPTGMAAAESMGQQEKVQADGKDTAEHSSETISEALSDSISEALPEADAESMSEFFTESASDNLPDEVCGDMPENCTESTSEKPSDIKSVKIMESESDTKSEIQSENLSEENPEEVLWSRPETDLGQFLDSASDSESDQSSEIEAEPEQSSEIGIESGQLAEIETESVETESEQISEIETEEQSETDLENAPAKDTKTESTETVEIKTAEIETAETESMETENIEAESTEMETAEVEDMEAESSANEERCDNSDVPIFVKEVDNNTAIDTKECDIHVPVLKELWVESAYQEAADSDPEQFLVKDFVLKGTFFGNVSGVNKIEYTTDLQTAEQSVWLEAKDTQTAELQSATTEFQIDLPDGVYPSIAIRAYDEAGNVSAVGQLVNDAGESIKIVVDSTETTTGETTQNQPAAKPTVKRTIKLKTTDTEVSKSEITNPENQNSEILNPESSISEISKQEIQNSEIMDPELSILEISKQEIPNSEMITPESSIPEIAKPEISKQEIIKTEVPEPMVIKPETSKPEASKSEVLESEATKTENFKEATNSNLSELKDVKTNILNRNALNTEISEPENGKQIATGPNDTQREDTKLLEVMLSDWTNKGNVLDATFELSEESGHRIAANGVDLADQTEMFLIDHIAPKMTINLIPIQKTQTAINADPGNTVLNDSFNTEVTAVIRVTGHNFREEDFAINMPSVSEKGTWSHDGDVHTLRIPFNEDDTYHIECTYADPYGNSVKAVKKDFLIDTAVPVITIDGVENNSANNSAIFPVISVADTNMELSGISVSVMTGTGDLVQSAIDTEIVSNDNGTSYLLTLTDIAEQPDNVYHLLVSACDQAGNVAERTYRFSLNRNGSVYDLTSLRKLVDQKYSTYGALDDIQIVEMNMDAVEEFDLYISRNGALGYRADYTKEISGSEDVGYTYLYQIKKENFAEEGIYRLTMYSRDRAGNEVNSATDINGDEITFVVDNTVPKVVIDGVESGGVYEVEEQKIHVAVMDNFKLDEAEFILVNEANEVLERWDYMALAGEDGALDITIPQHEGKLSLLYRVKDATGNEVQTLRGDVAAPIDFIVNASQYTTVSHKLGLGLMAAVLTVISLSVITLRKRKKPSEDF